MEAVETSNGRNNTPISGKMSKNNAEAKMSGNKRKDPSNKWERICPNKNGESKSLNGNNVTAERTEDGEREWEEWEKTEVAQAQVSLTPQVKEINSGERRKDFSIEAKNISGRDSWEKTHLKRDKWEKRNVSWWNNGEKTLNKRFKAESIKLSLKPYLKLLNK